MITELNQKIGKAEIVGSVSGPPSSTDLTAAVLVLRSFAPEAIVLCVSTTTLGSTFLRKARDVGITVPVYGVAATVAGGLINAAGPAAEGLTALATGIHTMWERCRRLLIC